MNEVVGKLVVFTMGFHLLDTPTNRYKPSRELNVEMGDVGLIIEIKLAPRYMSDVIIDWYKIYVNSRTGWVNDLIGFEFLRDEC